MSDTRSRAAKLAAMAAAVESPHEAATAAGKLAAMGAGLAVARLGKTPARPRRPEMDIPVGIRCGAETFDGIELRRCTRPASQIRDGLLVCRQHERLDFVSWAGRGRRLERRLPERSVSQITARRRVPGGWHLFDHDGAAATRVQDLPVTRRGRPTTFDTEAVAAEIVRDGIWPVAIRHGMSYAHAARIRSGWRPKKALRPLPFVRSRRPGDPAPSVREVFPA